MSDAFPGFRKMQEMVKDIPSVTVRGVSCEPSSYNEGQFPIHRGFWEHELIRLFNTYAPKRDNNWREYGVDFENDVFWVHYDRQDLNECTCEHGVQEKLWLESNPHAQNCFQPYICSLVEQVKAAHPLPAYDIFQAMDEYDIVDMIHFMEGGPAPTAEMKAAHEEKKRVRQVEYAAYRAASKAQNEAVAKVVLAEAKKLGVDIEESYAHWFYAHRCNCGRDMEHHQWQVGHEHFKPCEWWWADQPQFLHKPSGYGVTWYKYPCREAYGNQDVSPERFSEIIDFCIASLNGSSKGAL